MSHTAIPPRTGSAYAPTIDRDMLRVAANVERSGMHVVHVGEGCDCGDCAATPLPPDDRFGYTIGLTDLGHPELLVRGLSARETADLLGRWGETVLAPGLRCRAPAVRGLRRPDLGTGPRTPAVPHPALGGQVLPHLRNRGPGRAGVDPGPPAVPLRGV